MTSTTTSTTKANTNPAASFRDQLLAEEPKLDAALKSFCSWIVASASTATSLDNNYYDQPAWTLAAALTCTRQLSKAINAHIVPIQYDGKATPVTTPEQLMKELAARVWNEIAGQGTRITKALGRTALQHVWKDLDLTELQSTAQGTAYCQAFEQLLMMDAHGNLDPTSDAALVWGGPQAVARRAAERQAAAATRVQEEQAKLRQAVTPMIEELPDDEEEEEDDDKKPAAI